MGKASGGDPTKGKGQKKPSSRLGQPSLREVPKGHGWVQFLL